MRKVAIIGSISIFTLSIIFHLLVILHLIPSTIVWGGRLENQQELLKFESISIALNVFFLLIMLIVNGSIKVNLQQIILRVLLWLMSGLFVLNTIGNLLAKSSIETMIFTPITLVLSVFSLYLAVNFVKIYQRK